MIEKPFDQSYRGRIEFSKGNKNTAFDNDFV